MNKFLKGLLLAFPAIQRRYKLMQELKAAARTLEAERARLVAAAQANRSPGLSLSASDGLTERLMAHPVLSPLPMAELASVPAGDIPNRVEVAERLIASYHRALCDERDSHIKREGEDLWTGLLRNELPELMHSIDGRDPVALAKFLTGFGSSYVWFGGITTCIDGYNKNLNREHIALTYLDKLVCLAESLGVIRVENPECGPWGANLFIDPSEIVGLIESELRIDIAAPLGIIHTDGLKTSRGTFHYRHINSLYSATRIARLSPGGRVCEIGGGLGLTAMYAKRLGIEQYTILDLPITCLLAGHYLLHAIGEDKVRLYGETKGGEKTIELLPYWECTEIPTASFELVLNQDSLPEISDNLIDTFLQHIKRIGTQHFLSINHESFHPRTVRNFVRKSGGFHPVYRTRCWVREGYVEELFQF